MIKPYEARVSSSGAANPPVWSNRVLVFQSNVSTIYYLFHRKITEQKHNYNNTNSVISNKNK